jgi:hypothetical protein
LRPSPKKQRLQQQRPHLKRQRLLLRLPQLLQHPQQRLQPTKKTPTA